MRLAMVLVAALGLVSTAAVAQDVEAGKAVFRKCQSCHAVGEGAKNKVGPELNEVFGRVAGSLPDFKYSKAMTEAGTGGLVWSSETMHDFLLSPRTYVKGTKMSFPGLKNETEIANLEAYLMTFSPNAPAAGAAPAADAAAPADAAPAAPAAQ